MQTTYQGAIYLSIAASIWGGMHVSSKYALEMIPPFTLLFMRYVIASVLLIIWCKKSQIVIIPKRDRGLMLQIGFTGYFLSIAVQFIGTKLSSAHMGAVVTTVSPIFQSIFAVFLLREAISKRQGVSIALALVGVLVTTNAVNIMQQDPSNAGNLFFLIAAALWGYYSVLAKKAVVYHPPLRITTWGILLATGFSFLPAVHEWGSWDIAILGNSMILFSLFYLSVISTTLAYYCWNKGLELTNPHQAGLFIFLQSIVGSLLGYVLLGEELSLSFLMGTALILVAVTLSIVKSGDRELIAVKQVEIISQR